MASMRSTRWRGLSASISRVPVARPRIAQAARIPPSGPSTTLHPVARSRSVQCPTEMPRTAARLDETEDSMGARSIARLARVVEGTYVSAMPNPDPQSPPTTVLVVDDEDGIRQALDRFLTRLGYRVLQAASGAEALDRQAAEQPQMMLSDIRMPNMSGVELVPKALAADSDLAIIMLTAIDEPRTAIECLKLGALDGGAGLVDRREHDDGEVRVGRERLGYELHAAHVRHADVGEHHLRLLRMPNMSGVELVPKAL